MSDTEHDIQAKILRLGRGDCRLFNLNAGTAWVSGAGRPRQMSVAGERGVWLPQGRPLKLLPPGCPDIGGCVSVVITPEMVGQRVAVAVLVEVKAAKGRVSPAQVAALAAADALGVRCGVARSVDDAVEIIGDND